MAKKKIRSQSNVVIQHLLNYGSITSMEAFRDYGITRLSAIIFKTLFGLIFLGGAVITFFGIVFLLKEYEAETGERTEWLHEY